MGVVFLKIRVVVTNVYTYCHQFGGAQPSTQWTANLVDVLIYKQSLMKFLLFINRTLARSA